MRKLSSPHPASVIYVTGCLLKLIERLRKRRALRWISWNNINNALAVYTSTCLVFTLKNVLSSLRVKIEEIDCYEADACNRRELSRLETSLATVESAIASDNTRNFISAFNFLLLSLVAHSCWENWHPVSLFAVFINHFRSIWIELTNTSLGVLWSDWSFISLHFAALTTEKRFLFREMKNYF